MEIVRMKTEYQINPIGIDEKTPVFSWNVETDKNNWYQDSYRILVSDNMEELQKNNANMWDSMEIADKTMVNIVYKGLPLESAKIYYWKVIVTADKETAESDIAKFETAFFDIGRFAGKWIGEVNNEEHHIYRKTFTLDKKISKARAYICGLGQYELMINGNKVSNYVLTPGWTNYDKTCLYNVYDITDMLNEKDNALGVLLADGMYNIPGHKGRYAYFPRTYGLAKFLLQLEITYEDGEVLKVVSDENFKKKTGPLRYCCIYGGEEYDASMYPKDFSTAGYIENEEWEPADVVDAPKGKLSVQRNLPLKVMQIMQPVSVKEVKPGFYMYDLGKNFSGWVRIKVKAKSCAAGNRIKMKPGEILKDDGTPNQKVTGKNYSWDYYMNDETEQEYAPKFTYTGFRYLQVEGAIPAELANPDEEGPVIESLTGEFIYPEMELMGEFKCSNDLYNKIHGIITQAMLSNMKSVLTDCPHREKLGWLEQSHLIGPAIMYNYDVHNLYEKIEGDMADAQHEDGLVPDICPEYITEFVKWHYGYLDSPEWGSACVINPWYMYKKYGDIAIFERNYDTMKKYVDYLTSKTHHNVLHHGLGDWLDIGPMVPYSQNTPVPVIATTIYYYDLSIMVRVAKLLGKEDDEKKYKDLMEKVFEEYNLQFLDDQTNRYANGSQAAQALSLMVGLVPKEREEKVLEMLVKDITVRGYVTTAGDVGHPFVTAALTTYDKSEIMNEMMKVTDKPGYGYQVKCGATTLTEEWDGPDPERPHASQNHFMLGSGEEWFYSGLGGIQCVRSDLPFDEFIIAPYIASNVDEVNVWHMHPYGKIAVDWVRNDDKSAKINIEIPAGTKAWFVNPYTKEKKEIGSGKYTFECSADK